LLKLAVCTPDIVRVLVAKRREFFDRKSLSTEPKRCDPEARWSLGGGEGRATLETQTLRVEVDLASGALSFIDRQRGVLLQEQGRSFEPIRVQGEDAFSVRQTWEARAGEAFYGLGQHQQGFLDIRGYPLSLVQYNTEIVVPMLASSLGYGIFWDNASWTRWGDRTEFVPLSRNQRHYAETFTAGEAGAYLFRTYASGAIRLALDGKTVIEHFHQGWLPGTDLARVELSAGQRVRVELTHSPDMNVPIAELAVKAPAGDDLTTPAPGRRGGLAQSFSAPMWRGRAGL
jgi:hypothetical protein